MYQQAAVLVAILAAALPTTCTDPTGTEVNQQVLNGLATINGLSTVNGLATVNGLSTVNGLTTVNGISSINGLSTVNGLATVNGLSVDCKGKELGTSCSGAPDGILSATSGLLSKAERVETAQYMIRCALPKGDSISVKDYTGALITLNGELGLAASWKTGLCDTDCQEMVSACLASLTNGSGKHVTVELRSMNPTLGWTGTFPLQEAAFYGNLFTSPPTMQFCIGRDFEGIAGVDWIAPAQRACAGFPPVVGCPYKLAGNCVHPQYVATGSPTCDWDFTGSVMTACSTANDMSWLNYNNGDKKWKNVITTYRKTQLE